MEEIRTGLQDADALAFMKAYPKVEAGEIPRSVWLAVHGGESLVGAYGSMLREENARLKEELDVRGKAVGSVRSSGSAMVEDGFLRGLEEG